jgi:hypothetical protein
MNSGQQLLVVVACICCLFVVATALPSADPRIDAGDGSGWEPVVDSETDTTGETDLTDGSDDPRDDEDNPQEDDPREDDPQDEQGSSGADIAVTGEIAPANQIRIDVIQTPGSGAIETPVLVDGERVGEDRVGDSEETSYTVPFTEEITISVPEHNVSETFDVETEAALAANDSLIPGRRVNVTATIGSESLPGAAVSVEGERQARTDGSGTATVELPEEAESATLSVQRDPVTAQATVNLTDITVEFTSLLVLPGMPTPVQVSADGSPVDGATVELGGETARTDESGQASLNLPVSDTVTVTATVGSERATATATGLYWRLTALVLVVPSVLIGIAVAYLRFTSRMGRRRHRAAFFNVGVALLSLVGQFSWPSVGGRSGRRSGSLLPEWSFSLPEFPRVRPGLPDLSGQLSPLDGLFSGGGDDDTTQGAGGQSGSESNWTDGTDSPGPGDRTPEQRVSRRWHQFVAHLGIERPETRTPGQVARRALSAGYPRRQVRTLVETFRDIEYGGREATADRVERIRETTRSLLRDDPEEGDQ